MVGWDIKREQDSEHVSTGLSLTAGSFRSWSRPRQFPTVTTCHSVIKEPEDYTSNPFSELPERRIDFSLWQKQINALM